MCKGKYSPKISEDLIVPLYQEAKAKKITMTRLVDEKLRPQMETVLTTSDLQFLLSGHKLQLDCGHQATIGHNFANTVIITSNGGGKIKTSCHECGY